MTAWPPNFNFVNHLDISQANEQFARSRTKEAIGREKVSVDFLLLLSDTHLDLKFHFGWQRLFDLFLNPS